MALFFTYSDFTFSLVICNFPLDNDSQLIIHFHHHNKASTFQQPFSHPPFIFSSGSSSKRFNFHNSLIPSLSKRSVCFAKCQALNHLTTEPLLVLYCLTRRQYDTLLGDHPGNLFPRDQRLVSTFDTITP